MNLTKRHLPLLSALLGLFLVDRLLKIVSIKYYETESLTLIPRVLTFELFENAGIAFSIPFSGPLLWLLSIVLIGIFSFFAFQYRSKNRSFVFFSYVLFIFGALSNLYDRIILGHTIDYLIFFGVSAVNLADGMIISGALLLIWHNKKKA